MLSGVFEISVVAVVRSGIFLGEAVVLCGLQLATDRLMPAIAV